jgi:predicted PurR-regulated permease PerM
MAKTETEALKPIQIALGFIAAVLVGYVLYVGADILVPLAVALIIWFLIGALSEGFGRLRVKGRPLPPWLCLTLALVSLALALAGIVAVTSGSIASISENLPQYRANVMGLAQKLGGVLGVEAVPDSLARRFSDFDFTPYISRVLGALTGLAGNAGLILVYVLFLLLEQGSFAAKLGHISRDEGRRRALRDMLHKINARIRDYLWVKTVASLATAGCSYAALLMLGIDYAGFWALLIFLLNYIPNIGSLIAVAFLVLQALVQFEDVSGGLILATLVILSVIQFVFGNIMEPKMMGNSLNLSPLVIILALAVWGSLWGIVGMFLCVPLTVIALIILSNFETTRWIAVLLSSKGEVEGRGT